MPGFLFRPMLDERPARSSLLRDGLLVREVRRPTPNFVSSPTTPSLLEKGSRVVGEPMIIAEWSRGMHMGFQSAGETPCSTWAFHGAPLNRGTLLERGFYKKGCSVFGCSWAFPYFGNTQILK